VNEAMHREEQNQIRRARSNGVVLYADAVALVLLQSRDLVPWEVIRFTGKQLSAAKRVDLSRRLYGRGEREGLVVPPGLSPGPGVVLLPPTQAQKVKDALDESGASYDVFPIWRRAQTHSHRMRKSTRRSSP